MTRFDDDDPLDPKRKIFNALAAPGGTAEDPLQQPGPVGGGMELPPIGGMPPIQTTVKTPADFAPTPGTPIPPSALQSGATDYRKTGKYASTAYDPGKLARPWEEQSEKHRIGNVLSNFDPSQGLTPEVIAALNAADIYGAKFSGAGDKLTVDNAGGHERFGKGGTSDVNIGFKTGKGTWGAWTDPNLPENQAAGGAAGGGAVPGGGGMGPMGGIPMDALLSGDPMAKIQAALAQLTGPRTNAQALLEALR